MQVKKFEAPTINGALQMIKEKLGEEAVILSTKNLNKKTKNCVQVMAAAPGPPAERKPHVHNELVGKKIQDIQWTQVRSSRSMGFRGVTRTPYIYISEDEKRPKDFISGVRRAVRQAHEAGDRFEEVSNPVEQTGDLINDSKKKTGGGDLYVTTYQVFERMVEVGVSEEIVFELMKIAQEILGHGNMENPYLVEAWLIKYLLDFIRCTENHFEKGYHVFVGGAGHGKTSCLLKWVSRMVMSGRKTCGIVAVDHVGIGKIESLKTYAHMLNIPLAHVEKPEDWDCVSREFGGLDCVFVDFGHGTDDVDRIEKLLPFDRNRRIHCVQSILSREVELESMIERLAHWPIDDLIFTKLDKSIHGMILNIQKKYGLPLHSFGVGVEIPEDIEIATGERVVDLIFRLEEFKKEGVK